MAKMTNEIEETSKKGNVNQTSTQKSNEEMYRAFLDDFEVDEDDEEEPTIPSYALELFRRRNGSNDTTAQIWKQIENEIYGLPQIQIDQVMNGDKELDKDVCEMSVVDPIPENSENSTFDKSQTVNSDKSRTFSSTETAQPNDKRSQFRNRPHRLWRQSTEEYYLSTSSSAHTSSSGSSSGGSTGIPMAYGMSAALSAAMFVTASTAVPRSDHFTAVHKTPDVIKHPREIPKFGNTARMKSGAQKRRSITVIEEVSA